MSAKRSRIMYIEDKSGGLVGPACIGRVLLSKSARSVHYGGRTFTKVAGYKYNHVDTETGAHFWISGPKARGGDSLYGTANITIDDDVREEYWTEIRGAPGCVGIKSFKG